MVLRYPFIFAILFLISLNKSIHNNNLKMKKLLYAALLAPFLLASCSDDDSEVIPSVEAPETYSFERDGQSTVSFTGQTERLEMGSELITAMKITNDPTKDLLLNMFANENNPFSSTELNNSTKNIKSKTAASKDFFSANTVESNEIKAEFEAWMIAQVDEVLPNAGTVASAGVAGQIADGTSTRYVNAKGLEYDQLVNKGLIGALTTDQMLNNYLSTSVLDEASNREENTNGVLADGKNYTTMEHKWDEAYGYIFGGVEDPANPLASLGDDDIFLNKYLGRVENTPEFAGIADEIFDAFKLGRAAIVAGEYELRDVQADIIRQKISEIIAIRAIYYLQNAKVPLAAGDMGGAFHDLSEGYGFIYSLRFTRQPGTNAPYFTAEEVDGFLNDLLNDGANGLWDVTPETLDAIAAEIGAKFTFTVDQAAS